MRTKGCERLFESTIRSVDRIYIEPVHGESEFEPLDYRVCREGKLLDRRTANKMAVREGFRGLDHFLEFFEQKHSIDVEPFEGNLIEWEPVAQP
jgi:hypothetical protein